jgi:hypothetical protein
MKLLVGSDLIDQGKDVGLPFYGLAPDLGCFESNYIPTPVTIVSFTAKAENDKVSLYWKASNQQNSKGWQIERAYSTINNDWQVVGFVAGNATISLTDFSFTDAILPSGEYLYRLKQLDQDGRFTYSNIQKVIVGDNSSGNFTIFPIPLTSNTVVRYYLTKASKVELFVFNTDGKIISTLLTTKQSSGHHIFEFGLKLPKTKGMYIIQLRTENSITNKLVTIP